MMTSNQNLKRGHFTADKTLTTLQRLPFKKEKKKKKHSVEPQLFEEIFFSSKMKLETFRSPKCCKFMNVSICGCAAKRKKKEKGISSDTSLGLFSGFFQGQKRQSNATEKLY